MVRKLGLHCNSSKQNIIPLFSLPPHLSPLPPLPPSPSQFYASWCAHSTAAMPHFRDTLQYVVDRNMTNMHVGKMEVTKSGGGSKLPLFIMAATGDGFFFAADIAKNFKIKSTPTFIL